MYNYSEFSKNKLTVVFSPAMIWLNLICQYVEIDISNLQILYEGEN